MVSRPWPAEADLPASRALYVLDQRQLLSLPVATQCVPVSFARRLPLVPRLAHPARSVLNPLRFVRPVPQRLPVLHEPDPRNVDFPYDDLLVVRNRIAEV